MQGLKHVEISIVGGFFFVSSKEIQRWFGWWHPKEPFEDIVKNNLVDIKSDRCSG